MPGLIDIHTHFIAPGLLDAIVKVERIGGDRIVLGSDFPFDMGVPEPSRFLESRDFQAIQRQAIAETNFRSLLRVHA